VLSSAPHASPRQLEHPELTSPRQAGRQQVRAASASSSRPAPAQPRRPLSARPAASSAVGVLLGAPAAAAAPHAYGGCCSSARGPSSMPAPPDYRTPLAIGSARSPRTGGWCSASVSASGASTPRRATGAADACTQTASGVEALERQVRELQHANERLQTALLSAALIDGDGGELGGLLAVVDHRLANARRRHGHGGATGYTASPRSTRSPPAEKPWPFPTSKLPKGTKMPRGYAQVYPPSMA
jgi:hypothetical protein